MQNVMNPRAGSRMQQACESSRGVSRQEGEKPWRRKTRTVSQRCFEGKISVFLGQDSRMDVGRGEVFEKPKRGASERDSVGDGRKQEQAGCVGRRLWMCAMRKKSSNAKRKWRGCSKGSEEGSRRIQLVHRARGRIQ